MRTARIGDHVGFLSGFAFKSTRFNTDGNGLPVVRIRDVLRGASDTFYDGDFDERYLITKGDCLIGMDGEFNLGYWRSGDALLNQRVCKVAEVSGDLDRGYLARFLTVALKQIEDATPFVTVKHLSVKTLNDCLIPLPPLPEQKRIAAILDAADALRAKRRESIEQLDSLIQATFLEMFGDPVTNPKGWESGALGDWLEEIEGGWSPNCLDRSAVQNEWGVLKLGSVTWCSFDENEQKALPPEVAPRPELEIKSGDVLFSRKNTRDLVAAVAYVWNVRPRLMLPDLLFRLRLKDRHRINPIFLWQLLIHKRQRASIQSLAGGSAGSMPNISKAKLRYVQLIAPPHDLQTRFASIVESIEQQKARLKAHLVELDTLFGSLQSRAFNGELVA
jgi:type I restriction enzyme S subunit